MTEDVKYAGFWSRLFACLIDFAVLMPLGAFSVWLQSTSITFYLLLFAPLSLGYAAYNIYFHGRWGATIGKMIMKIKVIDLDGGEIGYQQAFYRHAVDVILGILYALVHGYVLLTLNEDMYYGLGFKEQQEYLESLSPPFEEFINSAIQTWIWSELMVLQFNRKRRAIHDYIAGTVVVHHE